MPSLLDPDDDQTLAQTGAGLLRIGQSDSDQGAALADLYRRVTEPPPQGDVVPRWDAGNPVGTETTQTLRQATPIVSPERYQAHQQVQQAMELAPTIALGMLGDAPGSIRAPIEVSPGPVRGVNNIVRFGKDASAINATLPDVSEGHTRLWRGNRPDEVGSNPQFTNDLLGIALPFREMYGGPISYVDVPTVNLPKYLQTVGAAPDAEFLLPGELAAKATAVHVTPTLPPQKGNGP
jgi:hypothetical protein